MIIHLICSFDIVQYSTIISISCSIVEVSFFLSSFFLVYSSCQPRMQTMQFLSTVVMDLFMLLVSCSHHTKWRALSVRNGFIQRDTLTTGNPRTVPLEASLQEPSIYTVSIQQLQLLAIITEILLFFGGVFPCIFFFPSLTFSQEVR